MELNLKGRTALITGASRGIGESIAKVLAAEGCDLTLTATDENKLRSVANELMAAHGVKVTTHVFDLSKLENVKRLADVAGDCDILINNAGAIPRGSLDDVTPEAWRAWLGPQGVRLHRSHPLHSAAHEGPQERRDHQHHRHGRRAAGARAISPPPAATPP